VFEFLARRMRQENKIKEIQTGEEVKLSLCTDDMILYFNDPKDYKRRLLDLIYTFTKVAGYKSNIQETVAFLCTNNELTKKVRKAIPFTIALKPSMLKQNFLLSIS
jgi:hypothetical protein